MNATHCIQKLKGENNSVKYCTYLYSLTCNATTHKIREKKN